VPPEFPVGILAREAPFDATLICISALLPCRDFERSGGNILEATSQTLAIQDADFDFGHIKPAGMFGRVVKLDAPQECCRRPMPQRLLEAVAEMGVEIIQNQMDFPGAGVDLAHEMTNEAHEIRLGSTLGYCHHSPFTLGFHGHKEVAGTGPFILVILLGRCIRLCGQRPAGVFKQLLALFINAHYRLLFLVGSGVKFEQTVHSVPVFLGQVADTPHQFAPRFEVVFLEIDEWFLG